MDANKKKIIDLFNENVRGKKPESKGNAKHDGKHGHWLEKQMGLKLNSRGEADLYGYEMKNDSGRSNKTSFGDWMADYYIFKDPKSGISNQDEFVSIFGKKNIKKKGRYSWSGEPAPSIKKVNGFGQQLVVDAANNIIAKYSYSKDKRSDKKLIIPKKLQVEKLIIAKWDMTSIKMKLDIKFNQNGWFKCKVGKSGVYESIVFGAPMNYETWVGLVKEGVIFLDSGMYLGNHRRYSKWRATNNFWDSCIIDKY